MINNYTINNTETLIQLKKAAFLKILERASTKIAPMWPLENFVAVNPYLGLSNQSFEETAQQLFYLAGIQSTLPISFYLEALENGKINLNDIEKALLKRVGGDLPDAKTFIRQLKAEKIIEPKSRIATTVDVAKKISGANWPDFMTNRVSVWAASYFDKGQAQWKASKKENGLFYSWKFEAETDKSPEVMGLSDFRNTIKSLPNNHLEAAQFAIEQLGIPHEGLDFYLHALLLKMNGWSSYIAQFDWESKIYGDGKKTLSEFLCVLICWEYGLYKSLEETPFEHAWNQNRNELIQLAFSKKHSDEVFDKVVLQEAFDFAAQRKLLQKFNERNSKKTLNNRLPKVQAVFCIDVRSEVFRRNLESIAPGLETLGFAGFFGFPIKYVKIAQVNGSNHCPVLIPSSYTVTEKMSSKSIHEKVLIKRRLDHLLSYAWKSFKSSAVSSFGFVSPIGLFYLPKLFTDSFGLTRPVSHPDKIGLNKDQYAEKTINIEPNNDGDTGIPTADKIKMAKGALEAMSLTDNFARLVLIVGHGSSSVNNPHASGLDCGACAGQSGEANAKVAAAILNDPIVREGLRIEEIDIPDTTHFIACLHDTTTDEVALYNTKEIPSSHRTDYRKLKKKLELAGHNARIERAIRMNINPSLHLDDAILSRGKDWAQVRPEWGLAGCSSFVVAPRSITRGVNLEGRSFLHSYNWKEDRGFKVLESIMTAPMIVTSWINLQYYASTVDNKHFGSGNKTLHNVTSGIGVLEGFAGDLRSGLPLQSIHDGENYQHEPLRLSVVINAPKEAMTKILEKHESVRQLCDNSWIYLMAMNDDGEITDIYDGDFMWRKLNLTEDVNKQNEKLVEEFA